jgi:hypothetical protein
LNDIFTHPTPRYPNAKPKSLAISSLINKPSLDPSMDRSWFQEEQAYREVSHPLEEAAYSAGTQTLPGAANLPVEETETLVAEILLGERVGMEAQLEEGRGGFLVAWVAHLALVLWPISI